MPDFQAWAERLFTTPQPDGGRVAVARALADAYQQGFAESTGTLLERATQLCLQTVREITEPPWLNQPPAVPGAYWWRPAQARPPVIRELEQGETGLVLLEGPMTLELPRNGQWCGPLTPPE